MLNVRCGQADTPGHRLIKTTEKESRNASMQNTLLTAHERNPGESGTEDDRPRQVPKNVAPAGPIQVSPGTAPLQLPQALRLTAVRCQARSVCHSHSVHTHGRAAYGQHGTRDE